MSCRLLPLPLAATKPSLCPQPATTSNPNRSSEEEIGSEMATFDPWPVFFRREWKRTWPFLAGFAVTGFLITKMTAGFTEEDLKNSKFVQEHKRRA